MTAQTDNADSDDNHEGDHLTVMGLGWFWKSWRDGVMDLEMQRMNVASVCFKGDRQVDYFELSMIVPEVGSVQTQKLCQDDERSALLQFKASFTIDKSVSQDPFAYPKVASWGRLEGDPQRSNCCSWDGVECNDVSGHVIGLDLASSYLHGSINSNSSLFQLVQLQRLDLSDNNFSFSQIPSRLGNDLTSLTYLNLSMSSFSGQIPSEISYLSKLSALDLTSDYMLALEKANFRSLIQNLTDIKQLHLSKVSILSSVPNTLVNMSSLTSLRLQACNLEGEFPVGIFHLPNLQVLDLAYNDNLTGYFPDYLNRSSPLKILNLQSTNFSGHLPASIGDLNALNLLNISSCHFYPHVPSSLSNLTQLNFLDLSSFYDYSYQPDLPTIHTFGGQVSNSWSWVGKLTNLNHLVLVDTNLRGDLPCSLANLTQLLELDLSQNHITGEIPCCLAHLTQLFKLDLGHNQITGQIPSCLMLLTQLTLLDVRFNNLQGAIPRSLLQLKSLEYIFLNSNNLSGYVQFDEFSKLKRLRGLRLSLNKLSVQIKTGFTAILPKLNLLELGSCNLTEFPEFLKFSSELMHLDLSDNNLHGQIPKWMWNSTSETLRYLNLSHNHLTGFEENSIMIPWHRLSSLQLDSNMLRGSLPIPGLSMAVYSVSNNEYEGEIPATFCNAGTLTILDLSNNNLNGMIPQCFENFGALQILKLRNNSFHGDIPQICSNRCTELAAIDLSYNQLQGKLPRSIANCPQLMFLNLGNNQISDTFPSWLGVLQQLKILILRSNIFHGIIGKPASSHEFPKLSIIDLSSNDFSGLLPSNYLENWNAMKFVDENEQIYVQSAVIFGMYPDTFHYDYPITVFSKGIQLKYFKTPYLLRLIDLSSNKFEGEIPGIIGNLTGLHLLNLCNNTLTGPIPSSLGNLTALESLDLSLNQLSGKIPGDLAQLTFLAYFNVSHNRLYGSIPQGRQFDTFQEDMYRGNSGLCGKPLSKKCEDSESATPQTNFQQDQDSGFQIELDWFVVLPGVVTGLIVGVVGENFWTAKKHDWFIKAFSRRREPRSTRRRRGLRT
ncbi:receptor-like protein 7 [Rosa chinensis]|uniref:receptor-like protein 7 n=1 Tax=Rosa chinensis TaxID=74649 RepID=UPI000D096928|nr:receptor-like protein 7 [Rosa chinensis]